MYTSSNRALPLITTEISTLLTNSLNNRHILRNEVQGFVEYQFLGFSNSSPLNVENVFGPKFLRNFDPTLQAAIEDIKSDPQLDKSQIHKVLLKKYLDIDVDSLEATTAKLRVSDAPNAYHSVSENDAEDYFLHLYFLQPYRLFSIKPENRKYISRTETANVEWLWKFSDCDVAPIFRKIIQVYILNNILQDYQNPQNPLKDELIQQKLPLFYALHAKLLRDISTDLSVVFDNITPVSGSGIGNDPEGLINNSQTLRVIDQLFPGFMDVMTSYPIGRLLFGQSLIEAHHEVATRALQNNTLKSKISYAFIWLFAHLNLSTSFFWSRTALNIIRIKWRNFKNYVTNPQVPFVHLLLQSLFFIPNAFILVSTPLLIVLPWIYGLTSVPFTLLRSFFMHGPFESLKKFKFLKIIDGFELLKDTFMFFWFALPVLDLFIGALTGIIPSAVLIVGGITSGLLLVVTVVALEFWADSYHHDTRIDDLIALGSTRYFQLIGSALFFGVGAYLSLAVISRAVAPYVPQVLVNGISHAFNSFNRLSTALVSILQPIFGKEKPIELNNIGLVQQTDPILLPRITKQFEISDEMQKMISDLKRKLIVLNTAIHLTPEQKAIIRQHILALDATSEATEQDLEKNIKSVNNILKNNFTPLEATGMEKLLVHLKERNPELPVTAENHSLKSAGKSGGYQPSWKILSELRDKSILNEGEKSWDLPDNVTELTRKTAKKCARIHTAQTT